MPKLVDNSSDSLLNQRPSSKVTASPLKLVISNSFSPQEVTSSPTMNSNAGFTAEVRRMAPSVYEIAAQEPCHYLSCELLLELEKDETDSLAAICHFPDIDDEQLNIFVGEDETLLSLILIQFQMKILKQLLLFCDSYNVANLIIRTDKDQAEKLNVYREVVIYENQVPARTGMLAEMIIRTNQNTLKQWTNYMDEIGIRFRQTLWQDHRDNLAVREYLKLNPCMERFC